MKKKRACVNCIRGMRMSINMDILCRIHGVVTRDFVCTRHVEIPDDMISSGQKHKCIDCEFFIQDMENLEAPPNSGFCQLFTVRYYNGGTKNACSKFSKKLERIVS